MISFVPMIPISVNTALHTFRSPKFASVVEEAIEFFVSTPVHSLPPDGNFEGVGTYAIYYRGSFDLYRKIAAKNRNSCSLPIYVGKAVPLGWRAARTARNEKTGELRRRLFEHAKSISQSENLSCDDFQCRFMILVGIETDLIASIEAQLIRRFKPIWNNLVDGFGNHDPGSGRYNQARSEWDIIHPGRPWANRLTGKPPRLEDILKKLKKSI